MCHVAKGLEPNSFILYWYVKGFIKRFTRRINGQDNLEILSKLQTPCVRFDILRIENKLSCTWGVLVICTSSSQITNNLQNFVLYLQLHYAEHSRDPYRSPMQWTGGEHAGFSQTNGTTWLPIADDYKERNVHVSNF